MTRGDIIEVVTAELTDGIENVIWDIFRNTPKVVTLEPFEMLACIHTAAFDAAERYHKTKIAAIGGKSICESYEGAGV